MVDGEVLSVLPRQDEPADGDDLIAVLQQAVQDARQGLRGVEGGVVEEDDGAGGDPGGHPAGDGRGVVVLPVQAVPSGSGCKRLGEKGLEPRRGRSKSTMPDLRIIPEPGRCLYLQYKVWIDSSDKTVE